MRKKFLAIALALCMVLTMLPMAALAATFDDVADDHWAASSIDRWAGYGVLGGHGDGTFTPENPMTRAEFASMLVKMLGLTAKSDKAFDDVKGDAWYADVVSKAVAAGIINGKNPSSFAPNDPVSFEEAAVMMCRAFGLAKTIDGDDWAKESIEKLTSLGMIGEGADEHLQVGVKCDRAVVAALADAVVAEYVNEDRAEPITGEVKGVVLVVNQAKVELKDATVAAPIVVESASVTLTNTQADNVKVSGAEAAVAADKESSVADVIVAGTAPAVAIEGEVKGDVSISGEAAKVELNGEVAGSVTVEEAATGAEIKGEGVTADKVTNNSAEDVKVNDETVDAKPDDTQKPDDDKKPTTPSTGDNTGDTGDDTGDTGDTGNTGSGGNQGGTDPTKPEEKPDPKPAEGHTHNYKVDSSKSTPATCTTAGTQVSTCDVEGCPEPTKTVNIAPLGHSWGQPGQDGKIICTRDGCGAEKPGEDHVCDESKLVTTTIAATCTEKGKTVKTCPVCGKSTETEIEALGHDNEAIAAVEATCLNTGLTAGAKCKRCGAITTEQTVTEKKPHTEAPIGEGKAATCTEKGMTAGKKCSVCGTVIEAQKEIEALGHHFGDDGNAQTCDREGCGATNTDYKDPSTPGTGGTGGGDTGNTGGSGTGGGEDPGNSGGGGDDNTGNTGDGNTGNTGNTGGETPET